MFNLTLTRKPSLWGRQSYFQPDNVHLRFSPSPPVLGTFFSSKTLYLLLTANRDTWVAASLFKISSVLQTWMRVRKGRSDAKMPTFNRVCSSSNSFRCSFSSVPYRWGNKGSLEFLSMYVFWKHEHNSSIFLPRLSRGRAACMLLEYLQRRAWKRI